MTISLYDTFANPKIVILSDRHCTSKPDMRPLHASFDRGKWDLIIDMALNDSFPFVF